ncbi:MAG: CooT family nickel-binding protein [Oscillospiraceae bacterium]|jgi:predicted RNA-binding protein|nr:CooT family nickel-binding protein [Oscillospiraceae bacterium]
MCLSTAYANVRTPEAIMAKNITQITFDGEDVILTDLMDNELRVTGRLRLVDLVNGFVILDTDDTED